LGVRARLGRASCLECHGRRGLSSVNQSGVIGRTPAASTSSVTSQSLTPEVRSSTAGIVRSILGEVLNEMGGRIDEAVRWNLDGAGDGENAGNEISDIWALGALGVLL
jgi:hypothetical protein